MAILAFPHELVKLFAYSASAPAAVSGVLTINDTKATTIPMREIDQVEAVVAETAGAARVGAITIAGTVSAGAVYRTALFGINHPDISNQALYSQIVSPNGATVTNIAAAICAAFNARQNLVVATNVAGVITFTGVNFGQSFQATIWTEDPAATVSALVVSVAGTYPVGTPAQVAALFPELTVAPLGCDKIVLWRSVKAVDGTTRKTKYECYFEGAGDAAALLAAVNVLDTTGAVDTQNQAQLIQIP